MLYPLIVPLLLVLGQDTLPQKTKKQPKNILAELAESIYEVLFFGKSGLCTKNIPQYLCNTSTQKYKKKSCGLERSEIEERGNGKESQTDEDMKINIPVIEYNTMHRELSTHASVQNINDFLFLCQLYNLEMQGTEDYDKEYEYREIRDRFDCSSNSADAKLFDRALIIAAFAADGAKELTETENTSANKTVADKKREFAEKQSKAAKIANDIRKKRKCSQRPKGSIYYIDLLSVLDKFLEHKSISHTLSDLLKLTIIDPESLDVRSGNESSHFLDNIGDEIYTLAMSPEFFFAHNNDHKQYLHNLMSVAINPNETHFCYMENELRKYTNDIPDFITELLLFTYNELLTHYDADDGKKKQLVNAEKFIRDLATFDSLYNNDKAVRKPLLMEMFIRLISAVLKNNWDDINLIPWSTYYFDLLTVLGSFLDNKSLSPTLTDLLKLTIIDTESLDVWSGKESSHFLDNIGDEIYTLVLSPEYFFAHHNGHEQYLHNLMSIAINPNEAHFCYVENKLRKYTNDISAFVTELLLFTYNELLTHYDVDDSKKEHLINAGKYIRGLTKPESLDENEKTARKYLLWEMYIHLICAVLTNNWEDIKLIPMMRTSPELIQAPDSIISHINTTGLNKYLRGESSDDSVLTNALAMYEEAGRLITSNESLLQWFDKRYSKQFLVLISSSQAQNRLFAEGSSYPNIFSLYRRWLARKKAYIYTCYKEISLRSDIISMKICNDYMKLYREDKSAVLHFTVIDNSEVSRRFRLRQASIDDLKAISQMNGQEFSRKVFVRSPDNELEFGVKKGTIWLVKEESTNILAAFFIIVPIENNERLAQMKGVYGTATLAHEYAIENNCIDKPFVIFDAVIVDPKYRGLGFQRLGLLLAEYLGKEIAAEFICATVSPANIPSSRNFQLLDYKKLQTVYYPSCDTENTPGRRYKESTDYYTAHKSECDDEAISPEILSFLRENHISDEDYKQERVAVRDFVVFNIT